MSSSLMNFLAALCLAFFRFLSSCFKKNNKHDLPLPVTSPIKPQPPLLPTISLSGLFPTSASSPPATSPTAVIVHLDRSPTTMSDESLEVISLTDIDIDIVRLPSPWSPIGKTTPSDVWISAAGLLTNASGPVHDSSHDDRTSTLYSSSSAFDAFGISVFVNLDNDHQTPVVTPPKRRRTLSSISANATHSSRAVKCFSTPLTKLELNNLRSTTSISSIAYELRMGLFADGRSMSAFDNILSLLDQTTPESTPPHNDSIPVEVI